MIAKCAVIALLAIVASAQPCMEQLVAPSSGCGCGSPSAVALVPASYSAGSSSGVVTRNLVGQGKFPVAFQNCGPTPDQQIQVTTSQSTAPAQQKPTVRLPATIPAPRVIAHTCTHYKTVMRPRIHDHIITVPTVNRYIETTHKPVIESIQYEAVPVNCGGAAQIAAPQVQVVAAPQVQAVQTVQVPQVQTIQVPQVQTVQVPQVQTVQVPQVQTIQVPQVQTIQIPQVQTVQVPQVQSVQCQVC